MLRMNAHCFVRTEETRMRVEGAFAEDVPVDVANRRWALLPLSR